MSVIVISKPVEPIEAELPKGGSGIGFAWAPLVVPLAALGVTLVLGILSAVKKKKR